MSENTGVGCGDSPRREKQLEVICTSCGASTLDGAASCRGIGKGGEKMTFQVALVDLDGQDSHYYKNRQVHSATVVAIPMADGRLEQLQQIHEHVDLDCPFKGPQLHGGSDRTDSGRCTKRQVEA